MLPIRTFRCEGDLGAQPLHCHEEVEFVAVVCGTGALQCGGTHCATGPGILAVVCPYETHAGTPRSPDFNVMVLNVSIHWFAENQLDWSLLWSKNATCESSAALTDFKSLYRANHDGHSRLEQDELLLTLCEDASHAPYQSRGAEQRRIQHAVILLRERVSEEIPLAELAASVGLSPSYFCRAFKKTMGVAPHAYQNSLRVARAKTLLEQGLSATDVALEVGFYDQSHLIWHFKRLLGTTPAIYQRAISSYSISDRDA